MRIGLRMLQPSTVRWLGQELAAGKATRGQLARGICEREDWRNRQGRLCESSARKGLARVAQQLGKPLPAARRRPPARKACGPVPAPRVECALAELGAVRLERVTAPAERGQWAAMQEAHHPQGVSHAPGWRLTYRVVSERHGVLGGISFVASSWHCAARDLEIGWSGRARAANLERVVRNDRFLILPGVRVKHLASHALGLAVRRLRAEWEELAGVEQALLETYVEAGRAGTCYRAAGWRRAARKTTGRPPGKRGPVEPKALWEQPG